MKTPTLLTLIAMAIVPLAQAADTIPLTTTIPPEKIEGTPIEIKVPNLKPAASKAPEIQVPAGTVLLSKGKPVTASDDFPIIGDLPYITDGEKDAGEGYFLELSNGLQWVQIDLEQEAAIQAVWLWHALRLPCRQRLWAAPLRPGRRNSAWSPRRSRHCARWAHICGR